MNKAFDIQFFHCKIKIEVFYFPNPATAFNRNPFSSTIVLQLNGWYTIKLQRMIGWSKNVDIFLHPLCKVLHPIRDCDKWEAEEKTKRASKFCQQGGERVPKHLIKDKIVRTGDYISGILESDSEQNFASW